MGWTYEQNQAIEKKGANILVSAAAGSGKTTVLVARIINKVINEKIDIDKLLVCTFTNPAASEMKERLLNAIYERIDENPFDENLQKQISLINHAHISTIHSFCLDIIRNNFFELGISANFRVADPTEIEIIKQEAIEKIFENKYEEQNKDFLHLLDLYTSYKDDSPLKDIIINLYEFICSVPFPNEWLENAVNEYNCEEIDFSNTKWGELILKDAEYKIKDCLLSLHSAQKLLDGVTALYDCYQLINEDISDLEKIDFSNWDNAYSTINSKKWGEWSRKRKYEESEKELKDASKAIRDEVKSTFAKIIPMFIFNSREAIDDIKKMYPVLNSIKSLLLEFEEEFKRRKNDKNIIDFNDTEHLALKLLVDENGNKTEIAKKFDFNEILIDEYQDINLVQEKILNSVSNGNNVFMVGDVKQSIYRFREARPDLFLDKYAKYRNVTDGELKENTKIKLYKNFRSRECILEFTNLIFQNIMSKELGEIDYEEDEYLNFEGKFEEPKINTETEMYVIDSENETDEIIDNVVLESRMLIKKINELHSNGINYREMAILLRSPSTSAPIIEKELTEAGIPVYSDSNSEYLESIEIDTIISLLKIIDNPLQDIPLVTVLRSPIGGFTDNELVTIRMNRTNKSFYNSLIEFTNNDFTIMNPKENITMNYNVNQEENNITNENLNQEEKIITNDNTNSKDNIVIEDNINQDDEKLIKKVQTFLQMLEFFKNIEKELPLDELIWKIYSETGYYHYVRLMPNGKSRQANLRKLFEKAKEYEQISFKGLFNFITFIEKVAMKKSSGMTAAKIIGENDDVIRLMSIHKSKGLEFPIVFLCGVGKEFNQQDLRNKIVYHQDLGIGVNYRDDKFDYSTLTKIAINIKAKREAVSEEMRVLYVALTRAKEKLIIIGTDKKAIEGLDKKEFEIEKYHGNSRPNKINVSLISKYIRYLDWLEIVYKYNPKIKLNFNIIYRNEFPEIKKNENVQKEIERTINKEKFNRVNELLNWKYPYEESVELPSKTSVTALKNSKIKIDDNNIKIIGEEISTKIIGTEFNENTELKELVLEENNEIKPTERGTLIHLVLQKLNDENIEETIEKLNIDNERKKYLKESINIFEDYIHSKLFNELKGAKKVFKEAPFYMNVKDNQTNEEILMQGIIDLYFINQNDELILVDYKTDKNVDENILKTRYNNQLLMYKIPLEKSLKRTVDKVYIYSTYLSKEVEIFFK